MALSNATRLADFGTGIGTQGAEIKIDNANQRVGIGTTIPGDLFQVGQGITFSALSGTAQTVHVGSAITLTSNGGTIRAGAVYANQLGNANSTIVGDGSQLTGVSGFSTALSSTGYGARIFQTDESITISAGTSYYVSSNDASGKCGIY